ncbi:unnamed protein product, partial [Colletotrichum noveboracense]
YISFVQLKQLTHSLTKPTTNQPTVTMQIQNVVLAIATLCLGAQAAFDCKCKDDAKTTSCCNAQKFISAKRNDGKLMCYVNNVVAPLPASFPFKTCCGGGGFDLCR